MTSADADAGITGGTGCPECVTLDADERGRVRDAIARRHLTCPACGQAGFRVGAALPLGFLFVSEDADAYLVGLTCTAPGCPQPRTGIRLSGNDFRADTGSTAVG